MSKQDWTGSKDPEWIYSLPNLHFHTSSQSESSLLLLPFPSVTSRPRFSGLNVLLTLFLPLSLRDGLSHLKLNTSPGATVKQPSVLLAWLLSPFLSSFLLLARGKSHGGKKKKKMTQWGEMLQKNKKEKRDREREKRRWVLMTSFSFFYIQVCFHSGSPRLSPIIAFMLFLLYRSGHEIPKLIILWQCRCN